MLTQLFNPTEIKKNGPATRPAIAPARRSASPLQAALAVLPATSQSYGAARVIVNGDHHRWWLCIPHEFPATLPCVPGGRGSSSSMRSYAGQARPRAAPRAGPDS